MDMLSDIDLMKIKNRISTEYHNYVESNGKERLQDNNGHERSPLDALMLLSFITEIQALREKIQMVRDII